MNTQSEKNYSFLKSCALWSAILLVILTFVLLCSCNIFKRVTKTKTITETVYYVDTIVIVHKDTIPIYCEVYLYDTAFIETETFITKSYVDTITKTLILEAKGKEFEVPVKIKETVKTTEKKKEKEPNNKRILILVGIGFILYNLFLYKFFKKLNFKIMLIPILFYILFFVVIYLQSKI